MARLPILLNLIIAVAGNLQASLVDSIRITRLDRSGNLTWTNSTGLNGHYSVETASRPKSPWSALPGLADVASTQTQFTVTVPMNQISNAFYRVIWKDPPITDSLCDYSGTQGKGGWFYGYYDPTGDFTLLPQFGGFINAFSVVSTNWNLDGTNSWLLLDQIGGHPEGTNCSRAELDLPAVRRWVSTVQGTVQISVQLQDLDVGGGNGAIGSIIVDGTTVAEGNIADGGATNFDVAVELDFGSTVDCVLDAKEGNECYDYALFRVTIRP